MLDKGGINSLRFTHILQYNLTVLFTYCYFSIYSSNLQINDISKKYIDTKQSNKKNNQNSKDKRQDYNMK